MIPVTLSNRWLENNLLLLRGGEKKASGAVERVSERTELARVAGVGFSSSLHHLRHVVGGIKKKTCCCVCVCVAALGQLALPMYGGCVPPGLGSNFGVKGQFPGLHHEMSPAPLVVSESVEVFLSH